LLADFPFRVQYDDFIAATCHQRRHRDER